MKIKLNNELNYQVGQRESEQIQWCRNKVHYYLVKGMNQYEIADILQVSKATITNDVHYLTIQAKEQMKTDLEEKVLSSLIIV